MAHSSAYPDNPHYITRNGWLRAAVLGANDGIVSVSALLVGVAAAEPDPRVILVAGVAGLVAELCRWRRANTFLYRPNPTPNRPI
jgi:VIT1/CCC1 family predicted Fe2+/Mn2+ transporter